LLRFPTFLAQAGARLTKVRRRLGPQPHDAGRREVDKQASRTDGRRPSDDKPFNRNQNYFWNHHDPNRLLESTSLAAGAQERGRCLDVAVVNVASRLVPGSRCGGRRLSDALYELRPVRPATSVRLLASYDCYF